MTVEVNSGSSSGGGGESLLRTINWKSAFWMAAGVPALVLFSIGGIAATVGTPSWVIWMLSVSFGFLQAFVYAEIAGLFPGKSGGASVYGAAAWVRYSKIVAPLSIWCNWLAWMPVLAIGSGLAAGYILTALFGADAAINAWEIPLLNLDFLNAGLMLRINVTSIVGTVMLLLVFFIQMRGISAAAKVQTLIGLAVLIPLVIIGVVPMLTGDVLATNLTPIVPINGEWNREGMTLFLGGLFIAAWSAYAFETAICYTSEFQDPRRDTVRAILSAGVACLVIYTIVPIAFQGFLGVDGMLQPGVVDGSAVASVMAQMVGGGAIIANIMVIMLLLALVLAIMTSMAGSSRTLYQGAVDGWLPRILSGTNEHGAPTKAMWMNLIVNLVLLMMSDYLFILAVSNCCYLVFNFLNLNSGWLHRIDNATVPRPFRAPTIMLWIGGILSFVNATLLGAGANVWGEGTLRSAIFAIALILPVFAYRHYVTDKGRFPEKMLEDLQAGGSADLSVRKAGILPYLALAGGIATAFIANRIFYLG